MPEKDYSLPSSSGAPVTIDPSNRNWMEEELDIVHLGTGFLQPTTREIGREFLRGAEISWYELGLHYDAERDLSYKLEDRARADLKGRRTSRINLYHAPGAGGTTLARRILWNFHRGYPCAILHRTSPPDIAERLFRLTSLTGLPLLLLVDGAEIAERQIDELYDNLKSRHTPVTLLQVLRRFTRQTEGPRAFYLKAELSKGEAEKFSHIFSRENPERKPDINALLGSPDPRFRSAFYFGLQTFLKEFLGLEPFVRSRLNSLTSAQKEIVGYLALAHHYGQRSLPVQLFAELLGLPRSRTINFASAFPHESLDLLVQADRDTWRTTHDLIAQEILEQLLWPLSSDRRLWKQNLSTWAMDFADLCRGSSPVPSDDMLEIVRRTFIYRDNIELLGTERSAAKQFSQLIQDIPSVEGSLQVLQKLTDIYPDEAHFWAHLGRFYSVERKDYPSAVDCIARAIELDPKDSVLHHVKGMAFRQQVYELIEKNGALLEVVTLGKLAGSAFGQGRDLNPDDEHGYISEVQMLAKILDYAGRIHGGDVMGYLSSPNADPYLRDCFERAEDLLAVVRRNREGQGASRFEEDCRAKIDALYGSYERALQTWDNLLSRKDVYGPPVRRQIVWTYLARRGRSWDTMPVREVDRMVILLEENLREEPTSDTNLRLWVQAVRRSSYPPTLDAVIERITYWRARTDSLESSYYLYLLYALQAIEGSPWGVTRPIDFSKSVEIKRGSGKIELKVLNG